MATKLKKAKARRPTTVRKTVSRKPAVRKALSRRPNAGTQARLVKGAASARALKLAGVSSDAVMRATGRAWDEWLKVLDRAGAKSMAHKDIALMLSRKFSVPDWWSQMVTVGYEQARGLRKVHENARGFSANASKTVGVAVDHLYEAWSDPKKRARWLPDAPVEVKRATGGKSMRMTWTVGDSSIDVGFSRKGEGKSQVAVEHGKLKDTAEVLRQKKFWRDALERLKAIFEPVT
jgi:hypothetical protein